MGECPAVEEDRKGLPFVGKTGREWEETYLPLAFLPRSHVYILNAVLCSRPDYSNPLPTDAFHCMSIHLSPILAAVRPQILVPMGAVACSLWPEVQLSKHHGIPLPVRWGGWQGVLYPMYHPSAGIHRTGFMIPLMQDFANLGKLVRELDQYA